MCQIRVDEDSVRCSTCGYHEDELSWEEVKALSLKHAEENRPSAIYYVEIDHTRLFP